MGKNLTRNILITGSMGFVGSHLSKELTCEGYNCTDFDIINNNDILNLDDLLSIDKPVDVVIHLAAKISAGKSFQNPGNIYQFNFQSTLNVLEFCRLNEVYKIIFVSSFVYGQPEYLPVDENHPVAIKNPYGRSKVFGELLCQSYAQDYGINAKVIRPFNLYGPGQNEDFLIPTIIKQALWGDKINVQSLNPKRDFIFVYDFIKIFPLLIEMSDWEEQNFEVYNVGSGKSYSVQEIVDLVNKLLKQNKVANSLNNDRKNEILDCIADISKISKKLNWKPAYSLEEGLRITINSFLEKQNV